MFVRDTFRSLYFHDAVKTALHPLNDDVKGAVVFVQQSCLDSLTGQFLQKADDLFAPYIALEMSLHKAQAKTYSDAAEQYRDYFIDSTDQNWTSRALSLPTKYRGVFDLCENIINTTANNVIEAVKHLEKDASVICDKLGLPSLEIYNIDASVSDRHNSGRTALIFEFRGGEKLVYKPRSHETDVFFREFSIIIGLEAPYSIRCPEVYYSEETYGWSEYIYHSTTPTSELEHFYQNAGALLAILHCLNFTDGHYENFIATTGRLILIDTETIGSNLSYYKKDPTTVSFTGMLQDKNSRLKSSVIQANPKEMVIPFTPYIENDRTTDMRIFYRQTVNDRPSYHRPTEDFYLYHDCTEALIDGYKTAISHINKYVPEIRTLYAQSSNLMCRQIIRHTLYYGWIGTTIMHPNKQIDSSYGKFLAAKLGVYEKSITEHEKLCLLRGDVPIFYHTLAGTILFNSEMKQKNFFKESALHSLHKKLALLSDRAFVNKSIQEIRHCMDIAPSCNGL